MFDGIKIQDVAVSADTLLTNDRLTFSTIIDEQTGAVLNLTRRATDRGMFFGIIPRLTGGNRVEMKGSLHKFNNDGLHNANDFTIENLLTTLDQLVTVYGVDPSGSKLNNLEFGVNVRLPFPVACVLSNLVSYKNRPFTLDTRSDTPYYQCTTQRYVVKLYDKGKQYGLDSHLLRVEIKVLRMEYLKGRDIQVNTLTDLLNVANFRPLGSLLVDTFTEILFDDPTIDADRLTDRERSIYQNGRNPRFWQISDNLTLAQTTAHRQRMHRADQRYRALLDQHGTGGWQPQTATLIAQTWERLTTVDDHLLTQINERRAVWKTNQNLTNSYDISVSPTEKCHKLTDYQNLESYELTNPKKSEMSQINPLYSMLNCDTIEPPTNIERGAAAQTPLDVEPQTKIRVSRGVCEVTGVPLFPDARRFVSSTMLRKNKALLDQLTGQFTKYRKGSKEDEPTRIAHNVRNVESNRRNNLRRKVNKNLFGPDGQQLSLFPPSEVIHLTDSERAALDYWKGTKYEVPF